MTLFPEVRTSVFCWPSVTLRGCFFHFCQALWRKLQQYDLVLEYEMDDSPVRTYFKMMCALPFVTEDISSPSSQVKCPPLSNTTNIPGLNPLTAIIPSHTTDGINMMLQDYSYHDPATSQRDGITDSEACFPARIHQSEVKMTKIMMREEAEPRLAKWRGYDERLQRSQIINDYSTVTEYLCCISNLV